MTKTMRNDFARAWRTSLIFKLHDLKALSLSCISLNAAVDVYCEKHLIGHSFYHCDSQRRCCCHSDFDSEGRRSGESQIKSTTLSLPLAHSLLQLLTTNSSRLTAVMSSRLLQLSRDKSRQQFTEVFLARFSPLSQSKLWQ